MKVESYEVLEKLPDPFLMDNGKRVSSLKDWERRRKELFATAVDLQYGAALPEPEFLKTELIYISELYRSYRITTGRKNFPLIFTVYVRLPKDSDGPIPFVISGDLCFNTSDPVEKETVFTDNGIGFLKFNRTELAFDVARTKSREEARQGSIFSCYPSTDYGCITAWAWMYSRAVDMLEQCGLWKKGLPLAFTGHSRGAKTALLAGVRDSRTTVVNPVQTCAGGASCYRVHMTATGTDGVFRRSETLHDLWNNFSFWLGEKMGQYADDETALPFDSHYLLSLVAPRTLLVSNAEDDTWANPLGSYQTAIATREVYRFMNCEENLRYYWEPGYHDQTLYDYQMLLNTLLHDWKQEPISSDMYTLAFPAPDPIFDWTCPEKAGENQ